jgi:hypothetical protein
VSHLNPNLVSHCLGERRNFAAVLGGLFAPYVVEEVVQRKLVAMLSG